MSNPWFRMYTDFLDDPKMISLAFEDQRHFIGILALKSSDVLDQGFKDMKILDRIVAQKLWIDYAIIEDVKKRLTDAHLIDEWWQPVAWNRRQMKSDHDVSGAERQRRYRENQRNALRHGTVTLPEEKRIEEIRKETTYSDNSNELSPEPVANKPKSKPIPYQEIVGLYHEVLPTLPVTNKLTAKRKGQISARWRSGDLPDLENWREYFKYCSESAFLMGKVPPSKGFKQFVADIEWLTNETNFTKVWEGKYHG